MNEYARIKHIQSQLKSEIQGLLLSRNIKASDIPQMPKSPLSKVSRQHVHNAINCNLQHIKISEELRDWLAMQPIHHANKIAVIIQARMGSTRLPGKVLMPLAGKPALQCLIERVRVSTKIDQVIVATTVNPKDQAIADLCLSLDIPYFQGSEEDVLLRVVDCAEAFRVDTIVDITGDCPLVHGALIDAMLEQYSGGYQSNVLPSRHAPDGLDVQIYQTEHLRHSERAVLNKQRRMHTGWNILFTDIQKNFYSDPLHQKYAALRLTLDTLEDYIVLNRIFDHFAPNTLFTIPELFEFIDSYPEMIEPNQHIQPKIAGEG